LHRIKLEIRFFLVQEFEKLEYERKELNKELNTHSSPTVEAE